LGRRAPQPREGFGIAALRLDDHVRQQSGGDGEFCQGQEETPHGSVRTSVIGRHGASARGIVYLNLHETYSPASVVRRLPSVDAQPVGVEAGARSTETVKHPPRRLILGWLLVLCYVTPLYFPPSAQPLIATPADAALFQRVFPNVPLWWMLCRLLALFAGAALIASTIGAPLLRPAPAETAAHPRRPWVQLAALFAAMLHVASLAFLPVLPLWAQYSFVLWFAVPGLLLAWGEERGNASTQAPSPWMAVWPVAAIIALWLVTRLSLSWHSALAADGVDMWRTFGRLVQVVASGENFLTAPMDPQLPGVTCYELLHHGLPILQMFALTPTLSFAQANAALLLAVAALEVAALCTLIVGSRAAAPVAVATFLFSPLALIFQLYPLSAPGWLVLTALLGLLLFQFYRTGSAALLAFIGVGTGLTASFPTLLPMTAVALALTAWRLRWRPRPSMMVVVTACLGFIVGFAAGFGVRDVSAFREMVSRYYLLHWSWAVGELAMQGQMSPTIYDWTAPAPPPWPVIPIGALLSPFAIARNGLRLWGDVMFEPLSIGLFTVGMAVCVRHSRRDRMSLVLIVLLAAAMVGAFTSTYDRPSQLRLLGSSIPLALLAGAAFKGSVSAASSGAQRWFGFVVGLAIALSGTVLFEVVNPSILPASSFGLIVRSAGDVDLDRAAILTAEGIHPGSNVNPLDRFGRLDWLRAEHPYTDEIARTVPKRPFPILTLDAAQSSPQYELYFWDPALEETAEISARICQRWPNVSLFTIRDEAGLSAVHAVHRGDGTWLPQVPRNQVSATSCAQGLTRVNHHLRHRHANSGSAALPPIEQFQYAGAEHVGQSSPGEPFWMQLRSNDDLATVTEFYATKFSKPKIRTSDGAQFADTDPNGSGLTVILAKRPEGGTEIMIEQSD